MSQLQVHITTRKNHTESCHMLYLSTAAPDAGSSAGLAQHAGLTSTNHNARTCACWPILL
jgi:hypothetical protein